MTGAASGFSPRRASSFRQSLLGGIGVFDDKTPRRFSGNCEFAALGVRDMHMPLGMGRVLLIGPIFECLSEVLRLLRRQFHPDSTKRAAGGPVGWAIVHDRHAASMPRDDLRRERNGSDSGESLSESREHYEIGVEPHAPKPACAEGRQAVLVLEPPELALHGGAATVEPLPLVGAVRDR